MYGMSFDLKKMKVSGETVIYKNEYNYIHSLCYEFIYVINDTAQRVASDIKGFWMSEHTV